MKQTVDSVVSRLEKPVSDRLGPRFRFAGAQWPPQAATLLAIKETRTLELWVSSEGRWLHIRDYPIRGLSGHPGPKLFEGDRQVPEGRYNVVGLNPNSTFHLSMKLGYPNAFDREMAALDGRKRLGGDIYIHGRDVSKGCLAMGDRAVEELFVMTALVGKEKVDVIIAPRDFRVYPPGDSNGLVPRWVSDLNQRIASDLAPFPLSEK